MMFSKILNIRKDLRLEKKNCINICNSSGKRKKRYKKKILFCLENKSLLEWTLHPWNRDWTWCPKKMILQLDKRIPLPHSLVKRRSRNGEVQNM